MTAIASLSFLPRVLPRASGGEPAPRLLVAYASGVLATAISRRLALCADVDLVPVRRAPRRLRRRHAYDAVVICPYLDDAEWRRVRDAIAASPEPPVIVDVREAVGRIDATIEDWGDTARSAALRPVVEALTG
ncbi:MAG TPA: hypothetical protein VGJ32_12170 [Solirubrobacteraceae bacterium]|jgi:hypothetical protein